MKIRTVATDRQFARPALFIKKLVVSHPAIYNSNGAIGCRKILLVAQIRPKHYTHGFFAA